MEKTSLSEMTTSGSFRRSPSTYRSTPTAQERMDPNRFVLYVSLACPWANRCLAALHLKKLEDRIRVSVVHPVWQRTRPDDPSDGHCGWAFRREDDDPVSTSDGRGRFDCAGCVPDPLGRATVRDIYADSDAKFTVVRVGRMIKSTARPPARPPAHASRSLTRPPRATPSSPSAHLVRHENEHDRQQREQRHPPHPQRLGRARRRADHRLVPAGGSPGD